MKKEFVAELSNKYGRIFNANLSSLGSDESAGGEAMNKSTGNVIKKRKKRRRKKRHMD